MALGIPRRNNPKKKSALRKDRKWTLYGKDASGKKKPTISSKSSADRVKGRNNQPLLNAKNLYRGEEDEEGPKETKTTQSKITGKEHQPHKRLP